VALVAPGGAPPSREGEGAAGPQKLEQALSELVRAPARVKAGEDWARRARRLAIACDRAGRMELSLRTWEALVAARGRAPWTLLNLAIACRHAGAYRRADALLREGAAAGKEPAFWLNERALGGKGAGRRDRARELLRRALAAGGAGVGNVRLNLGLLLLDAGRSREAARALRPTPGEPPGTMASLLYLRHRFRPGAPAL
jgi:tetratricopeptide (TPR) repeat protein